MPSRDKARGHSLDTPSSDDPALWSLWRLSLVLKEIGNNAQNGASPHAYDEAVAYEVPGEVKDDGQRT